MKRRFIIGMILICVLGTLQAQKQITLEEIWQQYLFMPKSVPGFNFQADGLHYTRLEDNQINQYDLTTGKKTTTIFDREVARQSNKDLASDIDSYSFNAEETKIIIKTNSEQIYRRSSKANFFVWDVKTKSLTTVSSIGKQGYATLSPDGNKIAYVVGNDLYYRDLISMEEFRVTRDGRKNHIINGSADWVYEEELAMAKAFSWSPDSKHIAFMRFDETRVREFTMTKHNDDVYPEYVTFKYPKVGEDNAVVTLHIFHLENKKTTLVDAGYEKEGATPEEQIYFPRIKWTTDPAKLCVFKMNRFQNELELLLADATTGATTSLLKESNPYYIRIDDDLTFLENGKEFIWTSEKDGFKHIYLYNMKGKMVKQLTTGKYDVTSFYGVDEKRKQIYYQAAEDSPLERQVYSISLKGKGKRKLTPSKGTNAVQFSSTFDYYVNTYSNINSASTYTVYDLAGKKIRAIEDNARIKTLQEEYGLSPVEFFKFTTGDQVELNGYMIKPLNFDESKQYPVFMYVYGGPGSQTVQDAFGGFNYWWFQMLAQKGYIVASVDNRGTGARGQEFKKVTYQQLGKYETLDQIEAAKYLGKLPYADASRVGIFGWSYGGYMSSLCILKGADVFKSAIAVAPVTNWKWYDSIYTERYMRTLKANESGYQENSPVYFAEMLKGNYLLVHGQADDNVHFQNSAEMVKELVNANKQFDTYFYPNRNHGIFGGNTRLHLYSKMTNFLLEKL